MEEIGLVGAGVMGFTVAGRILEAGYQLLVYDLVSAAADRVRKLGAKRVSSPAELAKESNLVLLFLPGR